MREERKRQGVVLGTVKCSCSLSWGTLTRQHRVSSVKHDTSAGEQTAQAQVVSDSNMATENMTSTKVPGRKSCHGTVNAVSV